MAAEPDFRDDVERWPGLTTQQRAAVVHRLVARSRGGAEVTNQMIELLALLQASGSTPGHEMAVAADRTTRR